MDIKEVLKLLVETDDPMERMKILEENQEIMTPTIPEAGTAAQTGVEWETKYNDLKTRYINTFFNGVDAIQTPTVVPAEDIKDRAETITIEDVLNNKGDK